LHFIRYFIIIEIIIIGRPEMFLNIFKTTWLEYDLFEWMMKG